MSSEKCLGNMSLSTTHVHHNGERSLDIKHSNPTTCVRILPSGMNKFSQSFLEPANSRCRCLVLRSNMSAGDFRLDVDKPDVDKPDVDKPDVNKPDVNNGRGHESGWEEGKREKPRIISDEESKHVLKP